MSSCCIHLISGGKDRKEKNIKAVKEREMHMPKRFKIAFS
jgi:hypothetical protein